MWGTKTSSLWWYNRKSKNWLWKMLPTCSLNLMRTRQCCRKSLFSEKVIGWSWQKSQGILYEKLQHFLNKECPYCPVQCTDFLPFSPFPPLSVMKAGKKEKEQMIRRKIWKGKIGRANSTEYLKICGNPVANMQKNLKSISIFRFGKTSF